MLTGFIDTIVEWKSKGLSSKNLGLLIQDIVTFTPRNVINLFIVYELDWWTKDLNVEFTLKDCLFGAAKLLLNTDPDKYSYSRYDIGWILVHFFDFQILVGVRMLLFLDQTIVHQFKLIIKKDILVLVQGATQGWDDTTIIAEEYSTNFSRSNTNFGLSLFYNKSKLFVCKYHKNTSIQSKKLWNNTIFVAFKNCFKRFCSQKHEQNRIKMDMCTILLLRIILFITIALSISINI